VVLLQPTSSLPPPPPPPPLLAPTIAISKISTRSDLSEQRHHQQDLSRSSDSINDQQWHMVSSNRGQRKGTTTTTTRRETTDESQATNKSNKPTSVNPGKHLPYVLKSMNYVHSFMFRFVCVSVYYHLDFFLSFYFCLILFVLFPISLFYRKFNGIISDTCLCFSSTNTVASSSTRTTFDSYHVAYTCSHFNPTKEFTD
jgi:hypothetical protein